MGGPMMPKVASNSSKKERKVACQENGTLAPKYINILWLVAGYMSI